MSAGIKHGNFTIKRFLPASPEQVFRAFASLDAKASWFAGPAEWSTSPHTLDFRVGGRETLAGGPPGGPVHRFEGVYENIVPNERIVYTYKMFMDDSHRSVSLATIEFNAHMSGTELLFTEQAAFLDGTDSIDNRRHGTEQLLENLAQYLRADNRDRDILSSRVFSAPRSKVFAAWSNPAHLASWWGPKGFTNSFQEFDFVPGGFWRFVMHGPDGTDYPNESQFVVIEPDQKIILHHVSQPRFHITATFSDVGENTLLDFRMTFDSAETRTNVEKIVVPANEENFDRLEVELTLMK